MPIKKAAYKDLRQNKKRKLANLRVDRQIKDTAKKIEQALVAKNMDKVTELTKSFQKIVDKAVQHGQLKKNTAARKKSRLVKKISKK
ncbi:MAG: 30S ribosomal protein S20 [Candidatus Komeilibacteria bacterium CG_4_10_14_0_2_um_filter_37_10]|uniref:Small ribosomal subunit protein bS20 n=1 Tax=Candidatus Komeilibacteria bacterium CG_4_10_14_0_2_um_filter_37_10 TaxID=1974470 RepID=A0A2M7VEL6_9BACT|nr:MAG: 30S ribosomal protein S20 [Candidatus Komeilibacteria bacterium CG_4_10_14_0_2_um_filter_37_10]PJA94216.1 MAG: 30S ribosomal protein S20 [Candidatus Komeilibacteria bacterium CG_4_9_14_3_um_filter_37_5]